MDTAAPGHLADPALRAPHGVSRRRRAPL